MNFTGVLNDRHRKNERGSRWYCSLLVRIHFLLQLVFNQPLRLLVSDRKALLSLLPLQFLNSPKRCNWFSQGQWIFFGIDVLLKFERSSEDKRDRASKLLNAIDSYLTRISYLDVQRISNPIGTLNQISHTRPRILTPKVTFLTNPACTKVLIVIFSAGFNTPNFT